jgi:hypothetical protein
MPVSGRSGSFPSAGSPIYVIITPWPDGHDQHLDYLGVNTVNNTDIPGADTATAGKFSREGFSGLVWFTITDTRFDGLEDGSRLISPQRVQVIRYLVMVDYPPRHAASSSANRCSISS